MKVAALVVLLAMVALFGLWMRPEESRFREVLSNPTVDAYSAYKLDYPKSRHLSELERVVAEACIAAGPDAMNVYLAKMPEDSKLREAYEKAAEDAINKPKRFFERAKVIKNFPHSYRIPTLRDEVLQNAQMDPNVKAGLLRASRLCQDTKKRTLALDTSQLTGSLKEGFGASIRQQLEGTLAPLGWRFSEDGLPAFKVSGTAAEGGELNVELNVEGKKYWGMTQRIGGRNVTHRYQKVTEYYKDGQYVGEKRGEIFDKTDYVLDQMEVDRALYFKIPNHKR